MSAKISPNPNPYTFIDIRGSSFTHESKKEFKETKEEYKGRKVFVFAKPVKTYQKDLPTFENEKTAILKEQFPKYIALLINSYCGDIFDDIPYGIPFTYQLPNECRRFFDSCLRTVSCCFLPDCCSKVSRQIKELNSSLNLENLQKATELYDQGVRWNCKPMLELIAPTLAGCTEPEVYSLEDAYKFILSLAKENKMLSLYWIIKHSTIHFKEWEGMSLRREGVEVNSSDNIQDFLNSWVSRETDSMGHAFIRALATSIHPRYCRLKKPTTIDQRHCLISAFLRHSYYKNLPKVACKLERGEGLDFSMYFESDFKNIYCKNYISYLLAEHFRFAVTNEEYEIIDLFLKQPGGKEWNVNDCIDFTSSSVPQHYAFYNINSEEAMRFWLSNGLNPNQLGREGKTMLQVAEIEGNDAVVNLLLNCGAVHTLTK